MNVSIRGLGTWLPKAVRANDAWPEAFAISAHNMGDRTFNDIPRADDPEAAAILEEHLAAEARDPFLGTTQRHVADSAITSAEAETFAAQAALADAGVDGSEVDIVFSNTAVLDRVMPGAAVTVAHRVGAKRALAQGIESACASALTQLDVACAYIESGLARTVLLTQSHLFWRTLEPMHPASPGLGDAATALVVTREGKLRVRSTFAITHGEFGNAVTWVRGHDDETDTPWWKSGGDFHLGSRDPKQVKQLMRDTVSFGAQTIREAAARAQVEVSQIRALASVQPRGFIPGAIAKRLGLSPEVAVTTYDRIAHVGACGPVMNLVESLKSRSLSAGATIALYAQGAGFTRAAAMLEVAR
jgi:3-oxoacyl-[acyl-carrier-protein] synthase III